MKILKFLRILITNIDLFGTSQFFRFKSRQTFQSLFGGIVSVFILTVIIVIFYNRVLQCIKKSNIYSIDTKTISADPTLSNLQTYPKGNFMAAIQISDLVLNDPEIKYFDCMVEETILVNQEENYEEYHLQPCTFGHWEGSPQIAESLKLLDLSKMMCLPKNMTFPIVGKYSSSLERYFTIVLRKIDNCEENPNSLPRCATEEQFRRFFGNETQHKIQLYFTNYYVTPQKSKPINQFLDDRKFLFFTETIGQYSGMYVQDFTIKTDEGILFNENPVIESGTLVDQEPIYYSYLLLSRYAQFQFRKSLTSKSYQRRFQKIHEVFSIAGGLLGILGASFFLIKFYNNSAYLISLGSELFNPNGTVKSNIFKTYMFSTFLQQALYSFLKKLGYNKVWKQTSQYNECKKETSKQIDVLNLLQKMSFFENAISVILEEHQIKGLRLRQKLSLGEARKQRESINLKKEFEKVQKSDVIERGGINESSNKIVSTRHRKGQSNFSLFSIEQNSIADDSILINSLCNRENKNVYSFRNPLGQKNAEKDSEESSESSQNQNQNKDKNQNKQQDIMKDIQNIKEEANKGEKISKKIMTLLKFFAFQKKKDQKDLNKKADPFFLQQKQTQIQFTEEDFMHNENPFQIEGLRPQFIEPNTKMNKNRLQIFKRSIKYFIKQADLFSATEFFRLNSEFQYKTLLGGLVSILMCLTIFVLSYQKLIECINRTTIFSTQQKIFSNDPKFSQISTASQELFMVDLNILGLNLNHPSVRYFDFTLQNKVSRFHESNRSWTHEVLRYSLEECKSQNWNKFQKHIQKIDFSEKLCFPVGIQFSLQGKKSSKEIRTLDLVIQTCKNETNSLKPCDVNETYNYLTYNINNYFKLRIANPIINAKNKNYIQYYLQQRAFSFLSYDMVNIVQIYFEDYVIFTDRSIFPWTDQFVQKGLMITQPPSINTYESIGNTQGFARIKFFKSFNSKNYHRTFLKITQVFAYIGGIFGIASILLFTVSSYNNLAYEISLASQLFKPEQFHENLFKKYNFSSYFLQRLQNCIQFFGISLNWETTIQYGKCQKEMEKQLDVRFLLKRLDFVECSIETILQDFEVKVLQLKSNSALIEAKDQRQALKQKKFVNSIKKEIAKRRESDELQSQANGGQHRQANKMNLGEGFVKERQFFGNGEEDNTSSGSQDSSEKRNQQDNHKFIEYMQKLDQEAKKGHRVSQKIMNLSQKVVPQLLQSSRPATQINQKLTNGQIVSPFTVQVQEFNDLEKEKDKNQEILNPFKPKLTRLSKFSQKRTSGSKKK